MPQAARELDMVLCSIHNVQNIKDGSPDVLVGWLRAARVADEVLCPSFNVIERGEPTVWINFRDAARVGDPTVHGGRISRGCATVYIGSEQSNCAAASAALHAVAVGFGG